MDKFINGYLREKDILELIKLSKSTRWRLERDGKFPKRRKLSSNTVGWLKSEIETWLKSRELADPVNN